MAASARRILTVRDGALGDFIVTLPALQALRQLHPNAQLHLITRPAYLELAIAFGIADGGHSIDSASMAQLFTTGMNPDGRLPEWLGECEAAWTWLKDPQGGFRANLRACGVRSVWQMPWNATAPNAPAARQLAGGLELTSSPFALDFSTVEPGKIELHVDGSWIALHPGSGSSRKNWRWECWIVVLSHLQVWNPKVGFVIVTGEAEEPLIPHFLTALNESRIKHIHLHARSLPLLARTLHQCSAFVGHDSGVAHLAAACGLPCRVLFGPSDPSIWAPQGPDTKVLQALDGDLDNLDTVAVTRFVDDLAIDTATRPPHHAPDHDS